MFKPKKQVKVPLRTFYCELNNRSQDENAEDVETLIEKLDLQVPRLKNSNMEKQWAFQLLWGKLEQDDFRERGINQIFIFAAEGEELLARLETQPFNDEPARNLTPPDATAYDRWQAGVEKQFQRLYGISVDDWQSLSRLES